MNSPSGDLCPVRLDSRLGQIERLDGRERFWFIGEQSEASKRESAER
jgi:hypothetical protein